MIYPSTFETKIGFDAVRRELERHCVSALGTANVPRLRFSTRRDEVIRWLEETNEFLSIVQTGKEFPLSYYFDLRVVLKEVSTPGTFLSACSVCWLLPVRLSVSLLPTVTAIRLIRDCGRSPAVCRPSPS